MTAKGGVEGPECSGSLGARREVQLALAPTQRERVGEEVDEKEEEWRSTVMLDGIRESDLPCSTFNCEFIP